MEDLYELSDPESYDLFAFDLDSTMTLIPPDRSVLEISQYSLRSDYLDYSTREEVNDTHNDPVDNTNLQSDGETHSTNNVDVLQFYVWIKVYPILLV